MMKLEFLGTGAADYLLERDCNEAEFRRYTSTLLDQALLFDPGPHIFHYAETFGKMDLFDNLETVLITHSHGDHLCVESVRRLAALSPYCKFAGNAASLEVIEQAGVKVDYTVLKPFEAYTFGNYKVTPVFANHYTGRYDEQPLLYSVETDGKKLFYATDTGWLPAATWDYISTMRYDAMVFELTVGEASYDCRIFTHTSVEMLRIMLRTLCHRDKHCNATNFGCKLFATHMAKTLHPDHATLAAMLAPLNVTPAYDGMIAQI